MTLDEYQYKAMSYALDSAKSLSYMTFGLSGEVGELHSVLAKSLRDGFDRDKMVEDCIKELGDVLWFVSGIANQFGYSLDDVAAINLAKLESRKQRNKIQGSGDNR